MTTPVVVGMSGGVDSSVTALLLQQQGVTVHGVFMQNWNDSYCTAREDLQDAEDVCATLGIPLHKVNFAREYRERVFAYFLDELRRGRTPNPDVFCNREIKFSPLLDHAKRLGADRLATGHYARIRETDQGFELLKGVDEHKDQSYFLCALTQTQLAHAQFPLGHLTKPTVRQLARQAGLVTNDKKDSTGICFIGERPFREFLQQHLPTHPGPIVTPTGEVVGEHLGLAFYTIGQRQGLHIGGQRQGNGQPWFVAGKSLATDELIVVQGSDHPALFSQTLIADGLHWIAGCPPSSLRCRAKVRYRQVEQPCNVEPLHPTRYRVHFDVPQRAITPGQVIAFYADELCLGGGVIAASTDNPLIHGENRH